MKGRAWLLTSWLAAACAGAQTVAPPSGHEPGPIQDNSFLVEEAYNQDPGVVQHIQQYLWTPSSGTWLYTFTQEWPVGGVKHQLSYTLAVARVSGDAGAATGLSDVLINYRYQLVGDSDAPVAVAPRLTVVLPTGSSRRGLGAGGAGVQVALPASFILSERFQANANVGATWIAGAKDELGDQARAIGYDVGASLIWRGSNRLDLLFEAIWIGAQVPTAPGRVKSTSTCLLSPGLRWAYNFPSGLQIVPGIGVPIGVGPSHDRSVIFYLSFEHPFLHAALP